MDKQKVLIISASAGSGHIRAGEALKNNLKKYRGDEFEVEHIDVIDHVSLPMKAAVLNTHTLLINKMPKLWGFIYETSNNPNVKEAYNTVTNKLKKINSAPLYEHIKECGPDHIVCTHFLPPEILANTPNKYKINVEISVLVTDYGIHELWLSEKVDKFFVGSRKMKWEMIKKGIKQNKIENIKIPVDPTFEEIKKEKKKNVKKELGLNSKKPTILILSGGQGQGEIKEAVRQVVQIERDLSLVAITGKNKKLKSKLEKISTNKDYKVIGWTDEIEKYIKAADVVISKPGGMTTTECAYMNTPIITVNPIPGQEEANAQYILENNLGFIAKSENEIEFYIQKIFDSNNSQNKSITQLL